MKALQDKEKTQHPPSPKSVALWVLPKGRSMHKVENLHEVYPDPILYVIASRKAAWRPRVSGLLRR